MIEDKQNRPSMRTTYLGFLTSFVVSIGLIVYASAAWSRGFSVNPIIIIVGIVIAGALLLVATLSGTAALAKMKETREKRQREIDQ